MTEWRGGKRRALLRSRRNSGHGADIVVRSLLIHFDILAGPFAVVHNRFDGVVGCQA